MKAADLIARASAHGIDLVHIAGTSSDLKGIASKRPRTEEEIKLGMDILDTAKGKQSRVTRANDSHAELGIAAYGVGDLQWNAAYHSIANDRRPETIRTLYNGLMYHATKFATSQKWEIQLPGIIARDTNGRRIPGRRRDAVFYREPLCMLVLDAIAYKPRFTESPALYAIYMQVEEETWDQALEPKFRLLQMRYDVWHGAALRTIQRRINGEEEREVA